MRTVKEADVRKKEILEAAAALFGKKGFEHTSVTDIMSAVNIAKGTLYHHFKSKEDIMDALIEQQMTAIIAAAKKVAEDKSIPVKERMIRTILAMHADNEQVEVPEMIIEHMHKPQNALMQQKTKHSMLLHIPPILETIILDGIEEGIFDTPYPLECMEMSLCYLDSLLDYNLFDLNTEQQQEKLQAFICLLEKLLGTKAGELAVLVNAFETEEES